MKLTTERSTGQSGATSNGHSSLSAIAISSNATPHVRCTQIPQGCKEKSIVAAYGRQMRDPGGEGEIEREGQADKDLSHLRVHVGLPLLTCFFLICILCHPNNYNLFMIAEKNFEVFPQK